MDGYTRTVAGNNIYSQIFKCSNWLHFIMKKIQTTEILSLLTFNDQESRTIYQIDFEYTIISLKHNNNNNYYYYYYYYHHRHHQLHK